MNTRPAPIRSVLVVTLLGSVSGGAFWAGIFFVTAAHYRFSAIQNLTLAAVMGVIYAVAARGTGQLVRRFSVLSARAVLGLALGVWGLVSLVPLGFGSAGALWLTALVGAAASATVWPIVESYLAAGRRGSELRRAIGSFNVTWTLATALPLLFLPVVARVHVLWTLSLSAIMNAGALAFLVTLPKNPGEHPALPADEAIGSEYPWLLRSASWLLPLSYVMSSTLAPVLPHRLAEVEALSVPNSVVAATWMVTRFLVLVLMSRVAFWHGRWSTLVLAFASLAGGLGLVLLARSTLGVVLGLSLFGTGMGLTYCAALYYSLAVGKGAVDAGGGFEALIGLGYLVGPGLGLTGHAVGGSNGAASATVALTWVAAAIAAGAALRPYLAARRRRGR